ncbi:uncharacterized protein LOC143033341 isoform X2 [Oratosquilla oratoria]|uniref:uncharacterized protein LOC143033341 isoform X2 n=1 Tax=Oratosquilla oratoria TaxID=337810 RepID=UPI003F76E1AC
MKERCGRYGDVNKAEAKGGSECNEWLEAVMVSLKKMGEQRQCWLRWHDYRDSVLSQFQSLRYDEDFLDVTLACDGKSVQAHKLVLSACSVYFRKVLKENPCDHPIIILDDIRYPELVSLIHFMYSGEVLVEEERVSHLLRAGTSLQVRGLAEVSAAVTQCRVSQEDDSEDDEIDVEYPDEQEENDHANENSQDAPTSITSSSSEQVTDDDNSQHNSQPPSKKLRRDSIEKRNNLKKNNVNHKLNHGHELPMLQSILNAVQKAQSGGSSPSPAPSVANSPKEKDTSGPIPNSKAEPNKTKRTRSPTPKKKESEKVKGDKETGSSCEEEYLEVEVNGTNCVKEEEEYFELGENYIDVSSELRESKIARTGSPIATSVKSSTANLTSALDISNCIGTSAVNSTNSVISYTSFLAQSGLGLLQGSAGRESTLILPPAGLASGEPAGGRGVGGGGSLDSSMQLLVPGSVGTTGSTTTNGSVGTTTASGQYIHPSPVSQQEVQATLEQYQRKLAFHEPRPCPTCRRMYRDAATLRTHMAIMHAEGREPFACTCGALFRTKYDMYQHKKNGHR